MKITYTGHALRAMVDDDLTLTEARETALNGETIERYPDDQPYPSRLMLAWRGGRPIHVVVADQSETEKIIVTAYRPEPERWDPTFRQRRPR